MSSEFEKWLREYDSDQSLTLAAEFPYYASYVTCMIASAWQARQPEIDALGDQLIEEIKEKLALDNQVRELKAERSRLKAEVERLKNENNEITERNHELWLKCQDRLVENERLRKDAERYRWLRDPKTNVALVIDKIVEEIPADDGFEPLKVYEYCAGEELDAAIDAAMSALPDTKGE